MGNKMKITSFLLSLAASTSAFAPTSTNSFHSVAIQESKADLEALAADLNPVVKFYDPLNLAEAEFWGCTNEESIGFLRHAGIKFPWAMQMDGTPFPSSTNPPELWDSVSDSAKWQIFSLIAFLEFWSELSTPNHTHYMKGGKPGDFPDFTSGPDGIPHPVPFNFYDPFKFSKNKSEDAKARGLKVEINNGRLAMLGIFGFLTEQTIPGSVPVLSGIVQPYSGEVMAPFGENVLGMPFGM